MLRVALCIVASASSAAAIDATKSMQPIKPSSVKQPLLRLRGGVSAGDVAHYGALFLSGSVGVPSVVGGADLLFKINYPGFDWAGYTSKWTPESASYLDTMTRFFGGALLLVGALQYFSKSVMDAKTYFTIIASAQVLFAAIQVFFAAPKAAVKEVHYVYAGMNAAIALAAMMAM